MNCGVCNAEFIPADAATRTQRLYGPRWSARWLAKACDDCLTEFHGFLRSQRPTVANFNAFAAFRLEVFAKRVMIGKSIDRCEAMVGAGTIGWQMRQPMRRCKYFVHETLDSHALCGTHAKHYRDGRKMHFERPRVFQSQPVTGAWLSFGILSFGA